MSRRGYHYRNDPFKYLDHEISLNANGKFYCPDFGIEAGTLEEVKAEIKSRETKRKALPTMEVYFHDTYGGWRKGQTTGAHVGYTGHYVWVSYPSERRGKMERKQVDRDSVYPVNEKNDAMLSQLNALSNQIEQLQESYHRTEAEMDNLPEGFGDTGEEDE